MTCPSCARRKPTELGPCPGCGAIAIPFLDGYFNAPPPVGDREFAEALVRAALAPGMSIAEASASLLTIARSFGETAEQAVANERARRQIAATIDGGFVLRPPSCRDWSRRAWPRPGYPRADARCDPPLATVLELDELNDDLDAAPRPIENWRELAFRRAARCSCQIEPFSPNRFCFSPEALEPF
jgi:hypothetical protein